MCIGPYIFQIQLNGNQQIWIVTMVTFLFCGEVEGKYFVLNSLMIALLGD